MKKLVPVLLSATVAVSSLSINPLTGNAEVSKELDQKKIDTVDFNSDIGLPGLESIEMPVVSQIDEDTTFYDWTANTSDDEMSSYVIVNDGPIFNWKYVDTVYSSDLATSKVIPWFGRIVAGGLSATIVKRVPTSFFKGVAGTLGGAATASIKPTATTYYKVVKYTDSDAYNVYFRYVVYQYSDKARTKLIKQYSEIHKG